MRRWIGLTRECTNLDGRLEDGKKRVLGGLAFTGSGSGHIHRE
jgi:hypothetical protein